MTEGTTTTTVGPPTELHAEARPLIARLAAHVADLTEAEWADHHGSVTGRWRSGEQVKQVAEASWRPAINRIVETLRAVSAILERVDTVQPDQSHRDRIAASEGFCAVDDERVVNSWYYDRAEVLDGYIGEGVETFLQNRWIMVSGWEMGLTPGGHGQSHALVAALMDYTNPRPHAGQRALDAARAGLVEPEHTADCRCPR